MAIMRNVGFSVLLFATLPLSACAAASAFRGPVELRSDSQIDVVRASAKVKPGGILVGGDVRRTNGYASAVPGHLRLEARDANGRVVAAKDATWGEFMTRRFRLAYFRAFLSVADPAAVASLNVKAESDPR